jgi:ADP-ribose pyrophosphatase YjhB (NUDIX family)
MDGFVASEPVSVSRPRWGAGVRLGLGRIGYRAAHRWLRLFRFLAARHTLGVRCVLRRGDQVLLVRHTYGDRSWALPGGRVRRGEAPSEAARREISQELGVEVSHWRDVGAFSSGPSRRKSTTVYLRATLAGQEVQPDRFELSDADWFPVRVLPDDCSAALSKARRAGFLGD